MRTEISSEPGETATPNEDYVSVAVPASGLGGALVLLDGVTPPPTEVGCAHGVPWFTARLGGALLELLGARRDLTPAACLATAISRTAEAHRSTCDLSHRRTPQATVVAARWDADRIEHLVLSDSILLLAGPDGTATPVLDRRLGELPPHIAELRREVRSLPEGGAERAAASERYVRAVEALRNPGDGVGFYTAAADPTVASRAVTGTARRADVSALLALSDGAGRWTERFRLGDWSDLLTLVRKEGTDALITRVRAAEHAERESADARTPARGKPHDDASALLVEL